MLTYDDVISRFSFCDLKIYLKVKDGIVVAPVQYAGKGVEEVLKGVSGVVIKTEKEGYLHYFVIREIAYPQKKVVIKIRRGEMRFPHKREVKD